MPSVEDEETGQVNLSSNTTTTANNNIIQFWNVIPLCAKYISTYNPTNETSTYEDLYVKVIRQFLIFTSI